MQRESTWKIIWDAGGASPVTLLDYGDLMDAEIRMPRECLAATGKPDFSLRARLAGRKNVKGRLEFSVRKPHATGVQSWQGALNGLMAAPYGIKRAISIRPQGGAARLYTAALLSSRHRPVVADGIIESVHEYALRVSPLAS